MLREFLLKHLTNVRSTDAEKKGMERRI